MDSCPLLPPIIFGWEVTRIGTATWEPHVKDDEAVSSALDCL